MTNSVCILRDEVAQTYSAPMTFANDKAAVRWLAGNNDPLKKDYKLYEIGKFDPETGKVALHDEFVLLAHGDQFGDEYEKVRK